MRFNFTASLLASASALVIVSIAAPAEAAGIKFGNHTFGGKFGVTWGQNSNAAASPAKAGKSFDDEDEDDDLADLEELIEDNELDPQDLAEDDSEEDDDDDDDGTPDFSEPGTPAQVYRDSRVQYAFGANHAYKINKNLSWKSAVLAGINRQMDRHELNRFNWAANTGAEFKIPAWNLTLSPSITYAQLEKAHKWQSESTIGSFGAKWKATKKLDLTAKVNKEFRNNLRPRTTNTDVAALKIGAAYKLTSKDKISFNFAPKVDRNENNLKSKDAWSADVGYARKLPWDMTAGVSYKYSESEFINGNAPLREDKDHQYGVALNKNFESGVFVGLGAGYKSKEANIANKGNHDKSVFLTTGYKF